MSVQAERAAQVRAGVRIELFTVVWMSIEAVVSIGAGLRAGSALLIAFGLDSVIELVSGAILLWRLEVETRGANTAQVQRAEQRASWIVAFALVLLCLYVLVTALYGLITRSRPESSVVGILIAAAAVLVMPLLGVRKRQVAAHLESGALRGDAANSLTCAYMAATVLLGVGFNVLFHWWWAEPVAALVFLFWLVGEIRESWAEAREGHEDSDEDM